MAGFVQIIEFKTSRLNEIRDLMAQMQSPGPVGSVLHGVLTADYERPGYFLSILEFESRRAAMENSARPEVDEFSRRMAELCDEPPRFYNLDVVETWSGSTGVESSIKKTVTETASAAANLANTGARLFQQQLEQRRGHHSAAPATAWTAQSSKVTTEAPSASTSGVSSPAEVIDVSDPDGPTDPQRPPI